MKAEEFAEMANRVVIGVENLESIDAERRNLADSPGVEGDGLVAEAVQAGFEDELEYIIAIANLMNDLATELFRREQLCIEYTADVLAYEREVADWNTFLGDVQDGKHGEHPYIPWHEAPGAEPPPPFEGAEVTR